jgi:hypothetical protein
MLVALLLFSARPASAQLVFSVCRETCPDPFRDPGGATVCNARVAACETKLGLYNTYMAQLSAGVTTYQLPAMYRELLQPFYSNNLGTWRFGFSDRQPPSNATTDCSVTYFNRANFVNLLRDGALDGLWDWLFHELAHFDQCRILGTRDAYSKMWFGHLEIAFIQNNNLETIHDRMMMEGSAETVAMRVLDRTRTLRDATNRLVRPFSVTFKGPSGQVLGDKVTIVRGSAYRVDANVTGGSQPRERVWRWMTPSTGFYASAPARILDGGAAFNAGSPDVGTYRVRLTVSQPGSNLVHAVKDLIVEVVQPKTSGVFIR